MTGRISFNHPLGLALAAFLAAGLLALPATARDIRLGGQKSGQQEALPPNVVKLPMIDVAIRKDDGGWHHVRIDAWLAAEDDATAKKLDDLKTAISLKAKAGIPKRPFESLRSAHEGSAVAKQVIAEATEQSLGHPWKGDVLIREMLAY